MNRNRYGIIICAVCLLGLAVAPAVEARGRGHVLARAHLSVARGGEVRAHDGWRLFVPPHTVRRGGTGTITAEGGGEFDVHIDVPWDGKVAVSAPLRGGRDGVLHDLDGIWVPEGRRRGQRTVWVSQLSIFGTIVKKIKGIPGDLCLKFNVSEFLECLVEKGIKHVNAKVADWIESKLPGGCNAHIAESGLLEGGPVGVFIAALSDPACVGTASAPGLPSAPNGSPPAVPVPAPTVMPSPPPAASPPLAGSGGARPIFTVMNTSETPPDGVWFRNSPHTADTDRVTGHGVYMGEQVELLCYGVGDAVGPYNDSLWYDVLDVSRPTNAGVSNSGWLNAHYINDEKVANEVDPGVVPC